MTTKKQIREFIDRWDGQGHEKQETQKFWLDLMQNVLGMTNAIHNTEFEHKTASGGFIDVLCPDARFLVEQKSAGVDLDKKEPRQEGQVTPVEQALRYADNLPFSLKPSVICTCNFQRFRFYDLEKDPRATSSPVADFTLRELGDHIDTLTSVFDTGNSRIVAERQLSEKAGILVANLHNAIAAQYANPDALGSHHSLAVLTVRFVFCLYAEDAGLFPQSAFSRYIESFDAARLRRGVIDLFATLNTKPEERDRYLEPELARFPYVNGGLFAEDIEIPRFTDPIRDSLLAAGDGFDWHRISPVIFGSLMEETLSHDQRRKGGMHYTTVRNIHKVIDPLFLDGLKTELEQIEESRDLMNDRAWRRKLGQYQDKLASLQFLDPACGSGNFLTETFLRLRELENQAIADRLHGQGYIDLGGENSLVKVSIDQFHGIEINDFAVSVAKTALWIAEQQALDDTEDIAGQTLPHLPLHDSGNIIQANALRYDWNELLPANECSYVMGNPPFVGHISKSSKQAEDLKAVWRDGYDGYLDYVTGWFRKAASYLDGHNGLFAFVSTNSITQGQPVKPLFEPLFKEGWAISFAHRTFKWDAQSTDNANVHVVIIGMSQSHQKVSPVLYDYDNIQGEPTPIPSKNINGYLIDGKKVFVGKRSQKAGPLSPELVPVNFGSLSLDDGNLTIEGHDDYAKAMNDPIASRYVRKYVNGKELINDIDRWCLWLAEATPSDMRKSAFIRERVDKVKKFREASKRKATVEASKTPWLFGENHQPTGKFLAIPVVFSERREYATCALLPEEVIAGQKLHTCSDPNGINFSIAESSMFITWQKAIGGRLKSDCQFSNTVVWNNLPLPQLSDELRQEIIEAGRGIIDARAKHEGQSLADLYDPDFMPADLRKAHQRLDKVVDVAFGARKPCANNEERLQVLFDRYVEMTGAVE